MEVEAISENCCSANQRFFQVVNFDLVPKKKLYMTSFLNDRHRQNFAHNFCSGKETIMYQINQEFFVNYFLGIKAHEKFTSKNITNLLNSCFCFGQVFVKLEFILFWPVKKFSRAKTQFIFIELNRNISVLCKDAENTL